MAASGREDQIRLQVQVPQRGQFLVENEKNFSSDVQSFESKVLNCLDRHNCCTPPKFVREYGTVSTTKKIEEVAPLIASYPFFTAFFGGCVNQFGFLVETLYNKIYNNKIY